MYNHQIFGRSSWFKGCFFTVVCFSFLITATCLNVYSQIAETKDKLEDKYGQDDGGKGYIQGEISISDNPGFSNLITAATYSFVPGNALLTDMSTGTTQLVGPSIDDTASAVTNIGFDFWYDGVRFTQFSVNPNGLARLGGTVVSGAFENGAGFASTTNAPKIAPYFEDLCVGTNGKIHFKVEGTSPNRKLIVEWQNMQITRGAACSGAGAGTFQMWLFESSAATSPGVIQFVYGNGIVASQAADGGASIGLQSGAATNFASVTSSSDTVSYTTHDPLNAGGIAAGKSYIFTPNIPAAPSGGSTTPAQTSIQLNWTDNATNEVGYAIFRSTDNINFTFTTQTAADAVMFNDTGLNTGTQYFYRIFAVSEGAFSSVLSVNGTTLPAGNDTCAGAGGNWDAPATWTDGSIPTAADNVTIGTGCTATVNVTNAVALNVTVNSGGTLQSPTTGAITNNNLTVSGNITNNGTLDFSTNGDTSGAILTFGPGGNDVVFAGTGATTDVRAITVAKGVQARIVELMTTNFTVQGVNTDVAGYLTITSGTFKISGTFTIANRTFPGPTYAIPLLGGLWMNNPNYTVAATASAATTSNNGLFRMTQGTYNIGIGAGDQMRGGVGAVFNIEGGTINVSGAFDPQSAVTYNQSGGTLNVGVVGNNVSAFGTFELFSAASTFIMSNGTINIINPSTGATKVDYRNSTASATTNITGGTVVIGATGAPASSIYNVTGQMPSTTVNATQTMRVNNAAVFMRGSTVNNNGTIDFTGTSARYDFGNVNGAMTYNGPGAIGSAGTPFGGVGVSSNSIFLITLNGPIFVNRINLFQGGFTNSNQITLGNAGTSATVVQTGSAGLTTPGGSFDVSPVHNQGSGGQIIINAFETAPRTTGFEINPTRILTTLTVDNTSGVILSGGNLTVTGAMTLTNGIIETGANNLIHNGAATRTNGRINGNLRRSFAATGAYTYHVGTANGYSPVATTVTAGTFPADLTVRAVQGPQPNIFTPSLALSRYWSLTGTGVTADLVFNYLDPTDIPVTATEANLVLQKFDGTFTQPGGTVNTTLNTASITGVTSFSDWTLAEPGALLDTTPPDTTINSNPTNPSGSSSATFTFSGTDPSPGSGIASFACDIDGGGFSACTSPTMYTGLANGMHTFMVRAIDVAGNVDPTPASYTWTINTTPPAGPVSVTASAGTPGPTNYNTLKEAFDAINAGTHQGLINVGVIQNTTETATAELLASGVGAASYTGVTVRPVGGARIVEGAITGAIIKLTGADNVTIDGRQGGLGTARDLTVRNNSTATATAAIWLTSTGVGAGATNNVIRNLELAAGVLQNASTLSTYGIIMASNNTGILTTSGGDDNDNNSFIANRIIRARYGIATRGQTANNNQSPIVTDNIIGPDSFGADEIGKSGIFMQSDTGAFVSRNTVRFVGGDFANTTSGTDRSGIAIGSEAAGVTTTTTITSGDYTVTRNVIHDIVDERTFSAAGVILGTTRSGSPTNNLVANNFIYNIRSNGTAGDQVIGISVNNGNTDSIVNNSISITGDMDPAGTTTSTNFGNGIRINTANAANNANFTVMNNSIFMDPTSNNATTHFYAITLNSAAYVFGTGGLNFNNYYVNPANAQLFTGGLASVSGAAATTEFGSLANWQGALTAPQDANSIQANPLYASVTSDLHIPSTSPNINVGTTIATVTDDIDGQARPNGAAYEIGADEFYPAPGVLQFNPTTYGGNEGTSVALTVTRSNGSSGTATVGVTLNNGTATGGAACGAGVDFVNPGVQVLTFGEGVTTQVVNVMLCTDTIVDPNEMFTGTLSNPTVATLGMNTTATVTITDVPPPFSGTINVGTGETYTSLTNSGGIFQAINLAGATGNIVINISSDLAGETGAFALNQIAGGFTVLIKPTGAARTITGTTANLIKLNGSDNVTIDGSLSGGTDRSLTINNPTASTAAYNVWIASVDATNGATGNTVKNCNIVGNAPTTTFIALVSSGSALGGVAEAANSNTTFRNNSITASQFAIAMVGPTGNENGNSIIGNSIGSTVAASKIGFNGIAVFQQASSTIANNTIQGVNTATTSTASGIRVAGTANGISINANSISDVKNTNASGFGANGIQLNSSSTTANVTVSNNFISDVTGVGFNGVGVADNGYGIIAVTGGGYNIYFNSISLTTNQTAVGSIIAALNITSGITTAGSIDLRNNILASTQTVGTRYAVINNSTALAGVFSAINYNDYFAQNVGRRGTTDFATLANWRTETGQDLNSLAVDPLFVSTTDLHIQPASPMVGAGITIAGITTDFDGNTRPAINPAIGADELGDSIPPDTQIDSGPPNPSNSVNATFTFSGTDTGGSGVASFQCQIDSGGYSVCTSPTSYTALGQGSHTFNVRAIDGAGNIDPSPAAFTWSIDSIPPDTTINTSPPNPSTSADATFTFSGTDPFAPDTVASFECDIDGGGFAACTSPKIYTGLANGSHTFMVRAIDAAGNIDPSPASYTWTINATTGGPVTVTATAGTTGPTDYPTVKDAVDAINAGTHQGAITVSVVASTTETATSVLNSSGAGAALYTSVLIRPVTDGVTVSGPSAQGRGLIELNGADNVTIDGDNPNTAGTNRNLTIQNTAVNTTTFTSVVRIALAATIVNSADNNTIRNLNVVGSATGRNISTATSTTASENTTFGIFAGPGGSTVSDTTPPSALTSVLTSIGAGATATNLMVANNSISTVGRGISINGSATTVFPGVEISSNRIGNPTAGDADQVYSIGITGQGSADGLISNNTVWIEGFIASSAATHGINVGVNSVNATFTIERNMVNRVRNSNPATWSAFGINLGGGSNHSVVNNFVSGVINSQVAGTGGFGTTFGAYGIRIASGTGHKIYHNSVHLYDPMLGIVSTNLSAAFLMSATTQTGVDVRNNIFSNQVAGGNPTGTRNVAVYLPSAATVAMNLTFNNNAYFAGTDALNLLAKAGATFGTLEFTVANFDPTATTPATNFRSYTSTLSAAGTNDNASFASSGPPPFTSNVDLHIPAGTRTRLESGGAPVGVLVDKDLEPRSPTTPDIGADEFAGLPPLANDVSATAFVVPVNGAVLPVGQTFSPQASFTNVGTATQTNVTVRYRILDAMSTVIYNETGNIPTIAPLQNAVVTFPSTSLPTGGTYTIRASSELGGDQDVSNDTINGMVTAIPPIGGSVNVGTGQTYTSLTNAGGLFQALNTSGISGNVTVNITSDLTAETGAVALNQLAETGVGGYTVTIKPSGAARTVSGTAAALSMIRLNGADRITIDGSLTGGTDRSLSLLYTNTGGTVVWIASASTTNGANNNTIKNCIIASNPGTVTVVGILGGSGVTLGGPAESPNNNNTIQNNAIFRVQNSIFNQGAVTFDQNWNISGNTFGSTVTADMNSFRGMLMGNAQNFVISGNTVNGVMSSTTTTAAMSGIQLAFTLSGGSIVNNKINYIRNVSTSGTGAFGMQISSTSAAANVTIANNFISDVTALGSATITSNGHGINVNGAGAGGYRFYHNSINMDTNQASGTTSAFNIISTVTAAGALDLRNNIFANTQTTGATRYAVYSAAAATVFGTINYNDYFAQNVGFIGGTARPTLADWQTATGQDVNSKAVDPLFVSATDLHIQPTSPMVNMGVGGTGITTDIDGDLRDATPDIGADEIIPVPQPGTLQFSSATYSGPENVSPTVVTVTRAGGSLGTVTVQYATSPGTATGGTSCTTGVDYVNASGTLTFPDGTLSQTFNVVICNDMTPEPNETINYTLSNPTGGATLGTPSTAVHTIIDDDVAPGNFSVNDVRVFEGNSGTVNAMFTVTYSGLGAGSVQYATQNGTALAGNDYVQNSGTVNFTAPLNGNQLATQTVNIVVNGDVNKEANETFFINLSNPVNGTIIDNQGFGIIIDEDHAYVSDFDNDKKGDYSVYRPGTGVWYALRSTNGVPKIETLGIMNDIAVPGDYDGDGIADFAVFRPSSATWFVMQSSNSSLVTTVFGANGDRPVQGDFDADGRTDRATFRPSDGIWRILQSSNGHTNSVQFGISTDRPVQADYDGDAQTDIAVFRNGTWFILRSASGTVGIINWGLATDRPVTGDFDGDGSSDITIYRDGFWWTINSLSGNPSVIQWGLSTDIPTAADFDGDGTTDVAVFRPSNGNWFVLRSSNNLITGVNWGLDGDVPVQQAYNVYP